ncbi:SCO2522 family protein [Actinacidiphila oryziradicis]|jgi:hypothetical protein|uniref:Uncharacterized protein n=1 Tax=Actinacidiphila oryziradicis TaxID=2571141 RepID=A0A4U0SCQ6_9ACTN|nr:SCO2522 family protein [Actinacidiphila oryziradicis]TKA06603.1 hypothetical protein FCI23_30685 [Actinacidiphila oryziradicis]
MGGAVNGPAFREATADPNTEAVPLSHVSLEIGHLYMEDFAAGPKRLRSQFEQVKPWADAALAAGANAAGGRRPRLSTCFLVDDYFTRFSTPAEVLPTLLSEAEAAGLRIDYLARESACAGTDRLPLARWAQHRLVESPAPGNNGSRPAVTKTGWLSNGERSPSSDPLEAMSQGGGWRPPSENGARRHSVFVDVELWDEHDSHDHHRDADGRTWSCPFLATVWQLLRLGLVRYEGKAVLRPQPQTGDFPGQWDDLPPLIQLNPAAAPFAAYRSVSVLPTRFLPVEHAVRVILGQLAVEEPALLQVAERAAREGLPVPREPADRISYAFYGEP